MNSFIRLAGLHVRPKVVCADITEAPDSTAAFPPQGRNLPGLFCRLMALALGTAASVSVSAEPIAPDAQRQVGVYSDTSECTNSPNHGIIPCAVTSDASFSYSTTGYWGAQINASANFGVDSMQAHVQGITGRDTAMPGMDLVQFDQFTVTGPSDTAQVAVHGLIVGSGTPSSSAYAQGRWLFAVGVRNPSPSPDYAAGFDWLSTNGRVLYDAQRMWSYTDGPIKPTVNETLTGVMTVSTGKTFELGMELTIATLNMNVNFSQVQWSFDVPVGYALTSTRGMSVSAVPEPGSWAMMMAGLSILSVIAARRRRAFSVQGKLA